ncbi:uncharacterized protein [Haliotis cracherodii]|uniref:uncharacterized protein isoform X2 n=1 Tax=Haliotis cracherodii TaxID=6455 RepID=UPI0039E84C0B
MHDPGVLVSARTDLLITSYYSLSLLCLLCLSSIVLVIRAIQIVMGNEGSAHSSECSTPLSEYASMYSYSLGSRPRSSVPSTRAPSPTLPPEPDLSHLSPEEVAKIKSVMDRAKNMQAQEQMRVRNLEEEYIEYATRIEREASLSELSDSGCSLCPICNKNEIRLNEDGSREGPNVCVDCEKITCPGCGELNTSLTTKAQEWVCLVCEKRRRLIMSTGLWYHGYHPEADLPLERELEDQLDPREEGVDLQGYEVPEVEGAVALPLGYPEAQRISQGPSPSFMDGARAMDHSLHSQHSRMSGSRMDSSADSLSLKDSSVSSFEIIPAKPSRFKGVLLTVMGPCGTGGVMTKSDSDEYSDYEMEDISEKPRTEGTSTDDAGDDFSSMSTSMSTVSNGDRGPKPRRKHRPKSLNLSRSHSLTSSDDEGDGDQSELGTNQDSEEVGSMRSDDTDAAFDLGMQAIPEIPDRDHPPPLQGLTVGDPNEKNLSSPTPPRSPSWREGLESPPFSPRRKDSYPGKRRGSPVSPKDKRHHFTYNDISPPSRQLSLDDLYADGQGVNMDPPQQTVLLAQKPSPLSPEEIKTSLVTTLGEPLTFDVSPREKKTSASTPQVRHFDDSDSLTDSAPVMDLATYAATIASSTASLTSMSVSPTNLRVNTSSYDSEQVSPESMDSAESPTSPVSPGYYDNATTPEEEVELADPSTKAIDYQGSKRQKARPPTTDWSPVIDLSPILDVSPSVEEAEQEDMLAKQMEELERQRSREEEQDEADEEAEELICAIGAATVVHPVEEEEEEDFTYTGLKRYNIMENISIIDGNGQPVTVQNVRDENGNGNYDDGDGEETCHSKDDFPVMDCTSLAQPVPAARTTITYSKSGIGGECGQVKTVSSSRPHVENSTTSEIRKISEDLQNMLKTGAANVKPIPPPKPRRKLPDPTPEILASQKTPAGKPVPPQKPLILPPTASNLALVDKSVSSSQESLKSTSTSNGKTLPRQDSTERRKAKDLKAKPNPLLIQHIESEEQSVSPQYKVLDSPPTPEQKTSIKREFSESTSVSPSSSPDHELYTFPSPVTPPDSDSSPPKPHSPSSTGTDLDEELAAQKPTRTISYGSSLSDLCNQNVPEPMEVPEVTEGACAAPLQAAQQEASPQEPHLPEVVAEVEEPRPSIRDKLKYFEEVKSDLTSPHSSSAIAARPKEPPKIEPKKEPKELKREPKELKKEPKELKRELKEPKREPKELKKEPKEAKKEPKEPKKEPKEPKKEPKEKKDPKKVRRKLPPIPTNEEPVLTPKAKLKGTKQVALKARQEPQKPPKPPKPSSDHRKYSSQSDDSMNEDDLEVARINRIPEKKVLSSVGKAKSFDISERMLQEKRDTLVSTQMKLQRAGSLGTSILPKDETDAIIDSLINIYGIPCTEAMISLKKRLQEELRRVTLDRKRKLEELEEIRALQMQIGALKLETELIQRQAYLARNGKLPPATTQLEQDSRRRGLSPSTSLTPRSSPQVTPRRQRHKRQSSDPMIAKFSPIKEDKDIEADFQAKMSDSADARQSSKYSTDDSSLSGLSDTESTRSEPVSNARYKKIKPSAYARMFYTGKTNSSERLQPDQGQFNGQMPMSVSRSESQLPGSSRSGSRSGSRTPTYYSDDDEGKIKEEKKARLQYEIDKRKRQLEETARLKTELLKLARARQSMAHSYDDIPGRYGSSPYGPQRPIPTGIIRPLDDESRYDRDDIDPYRDPQDRRSGYHSNYSSTEYLAHKQETSRRHRSDDAGIYQNYSDYADPTTFSPPSTLSRRMDSYPSVAAREGNVQVSARDARLSSSVTLPDMYSNRADLDFVPTRDSVSYNTFSDAESPASDYTPAMPLLDDVTAKSRKIIHDIGTGSRPVSAEFNFPGGVEDLMNAVYRTESDNSVDADEPIMKHMTEGGVTILKQLDRRRKPPPPEPIKYNFPTKRILVTRDPKDRCVTGRKGNGIGMKIVGGKQIPGTNQIGAFVTSIYPGGIAEQLHGELEIGDQVLEWNGISLSGRTYEDVQQIITQPNGEIEMVVRPLSKHRGRRAVPDHCMEAGSCHSSYDNLDSEEEQDSRYASRHGVDPRQLAAQLEEIQETGGSPENSPSSSHQDFLTPSMSSPCSTPHSDPTSTLPDSRQRSAANHSDMASSHDRIKVVDVASDGSRHHSDNGRTATPSDRRRRGRDSESSSTERRRVVESDQSPASSDRHRLDRRREQSSSSRSRHRSAKDPPVPVPRDRHRNKDGVDRSPSSDRLKVSRGSDPNLNRSNGQHLSDESSRSSTPSSRRRSRENESTRTSNLRGDSSESERRSSSEMLKLEPISAPPSRSPSKRRLASKGDNSTSPDRRQSSLPETSAPTTSSDRHRSNSHPENHSAHSHKGRKHSGGHRDKEKEKEKEKEKDESSPSNNGVGDIQLQISQDDFDNTLNVHVIQSRNLRPRDINGLSDPFVKVYLLPGRGQENKRRTRHISRTLNPEWHQTLMFQNVARGELLNKVLEITLWDYDRFKTNDFLGELILELSEEGFLDNKPHWYPLRDHVACASFELPKSSVPPPYHSIDAIEPQEPPQELSKPSKRSNGRSKKHGSGDHHGSDSQMGPRRRSLGTLNDDPQESQAPSPRHHRKAASATSSPVPKRRSRDSKSPNNRSNGKRVPHRCEESTSPVYVEIESIPAKID